MEPLLVTDNKKQNAVFVPYRISASGIPEFFLQLRDGNARVHANMYSLFGGGIDAGENAHDAVLRETFEELEYRPVHLEFFSHFETASTRFYVFIEKVETDFESHVVVHEGLGGAFFSFEELKKQVCSPISLDVAEGLTEYLTQRAA